ncbi:MAG: diguanylate cyclase [Desulfarculaceae bacterium]|nr:diguanylate cyclase [Desulfarculaceae bacterium]
MDIKLLDRVIALSNLIGQAGMAYIEADTELNVFTWNPGAAGLFGISEEEAMAVPLDRSVPLDREMLLALSNAGFSSDTMQRSSGAKVWYDLFYSPITDTCGEKLGIAILARDITKLIHLNTSTREAKKQLNDIYMFAPVGMFHADINGSIESANPEFAWMLGYESAGALVQKISDVAAQLFVKREKGREFMFHLYEADEVKRFRARLRRKGNSGVWVQCYAKITRDIYGRINGFDGYTMDISDTVRAETDLQEANDKLKLLSVQDGLTQIPNRRRFDEYLAAEWARHRRSGQEFSVIICDIDYFKFYNDTYGHQAGDDCLIAVAEVMKDSGRRTTDLAARYGGEEFAFVLPHTGAQGGRCVAEKIRSHVRSMNIPHETSLIDTCITVSVGVASAVPENGLEPEMLLKKADQALYEAKEKGRNRVEYKRM